MKQIALDGKKDPPFNVKMIVWFRDGWEALYLQKIEQTERGKYYVFWNGTEEESELSGATHYCIPTEPKK